MILLHIKIKENLPVLLLENCYYDYEEKKMTRNNTRAYDTFYDNDDSDYKSGFEDEILLPRHAVFRPVDSYDTFYKQFVDFLDSREKVFFLNCYADY